MSKASELLAEIGNRPVPSQTMYRLFAYTIKRKYGRSVTRRDLISELQGTGLSSDDLADIELELKALGVRII